MLDGGLTYQDLVPELDIEMSPNGLFTAEMLYDPTAQWDDMRIRIDVMFASDRTIKGTGSITIYTKDGLTKGSIKITRN